MKTSIISILARITVVMALAGFAGMISSASAGTDWDKLNWVKRGPIHIVMLWGSSKGESAFLLKMKRPGAKGKRHAHSVGYHGVTLQGTWSKTKSDGSVVKLPPGSHIFQPKNEFHIDECAGPETCILFIHFEGPRDVFFPKK